MNPPAIFSRSTICIAGLRVRANIGVTDEERASPQELLLDLEITVLSDFSEMGDDIARTIDYHALVLRLTALAAARPRRLIETLASDCADEVLSHPEARSVRITVCKFILPQTDHVAVVYEKSKCP